MTLDLLERIQDDITRLEIHAGTPAHHGTPHRPSAVSRSNQDFANDLKALLDRLTPKSATTSKDGYTGVIESGPATNPLRKILCLTGMCFTFRTQSDDTGCWGECSICQKKVGFVSREALRRYADQEIDAALIARQTLTG